MSEKIIDLIKWVAALGTIWYLMVAVVPNFYSKSGKDSEEYKKIEREILKVDNKISYFMFLDSLKNAKMLEEESNRVNYKKTHKKRVKEYLSKSDNEQTKLFNEKYAAWKKRKLMEAKND